MKPVFRYFHLRCVRIFPIQIAHYYWVVLCLFSVLLSACDQQDQNIASVDQYYPEGDASTFVEYSHNGLNFKHPPEWHFKADDLLALTEEGRLVRFYVSDVSEFRIYLSSGHSFSDSSLANDFLVSAQNSKLVKVNDLIRTQIELAGHKGVKLSWNEAILGDEQEMQILILQVAGDEKNAYAVFSILEEDMTNTSPAIIPVLRSIEIN